MLKISSIDKNGKFVQSYHHTRNKNYNIDYLKLLLPIDEKLNIYYSI